MKFVLISLLVLSTFVPIHAIICYGCSFSSTRPDCGDPFIYGAAANASLSANQDNMLCIKTKTESKGGYSLTRAAIPSWNPVQCIGGINGCGSYTENEQKTTICCCNDKDVCNDGSRLWENPLLFLSTIGMVLLFNYQ